MKQVQDEHIHLEIFSSKEPKKQCAKLISEVANPLFVALPTFLLIALFTAPSVSSALLWWVITIAGISAVPFWFILRGVRDGNYTDRHVSRREQRLKPLFFGMGCVAVVFTLLLLLHASRPLIVTLVAVIVALAVATVVTLFWKISFHLVGIAGGVTALALILSPLFLLLSPLVVLVAWARWQVHAHTPLQALAGAALAVGVTVVIFGTF